jgi:hypothetical protein
VVASTPEVENADTGRFDDPIDGQTDGCVDGWIDDVSRVRTSAFRCGWSVRGLDLGLRVWFGKSFAALPLCGFAVPRGAQRVLDASLALCTNRALAGTGGDVAKVLRGLSVGYFFGGTGMR